MVRSYRPPAGIVELDTIVYALMQANKGKEKELP